MNSTILTESIIDVLNSVGKGKLAPNEKKEIRHDALYLAKFLPHLQRQAEILNIDLTKTGFTFQCHQKTAERAYYSPAIKSEASVAVVSWGNLSLPLTQALADRNWLVESEDRRYFLVVEPKEFPAPTDTEETEEFDNDTQYVRIPLVFAKNIVGVKINSAMDVKSLITQNLKGKGDLGSLLSPVITKSKKFSEIEPGEYTCIGYSEWSYEGKVNYDLILDGYGKFSAPRNITRQLAKKPTINVLYPATVFVYEAEGKTTKGNPIIPVSIDIPGSSPTEIEYFDF